MEIKKIKKLLVETYPMADFKTTVKLVDAHEERINTYPYKKLIPAFVAVGVESRRPTHHTTNGRAIYAHPEAEPIIRLLKDAGFNARYHIFARTAQLIAIEE